MKVIIIISSIILLIIAAGVVIYFATRCKKCGGVCLDSSTHVCVNGAQCLKSQFISPNICCPSGSVVVNGKCSQLQTDMYGDVCSSEQFNSITNVCCGKYEKPCGSFCTAPGNCAKDSAGNGCPQNYLTDNLHCCGGVSCDNNCCGQICVENGCYDTCPYSDQEMSQAHCVDSGYYADQNGRICPDYQYRTQGSCCGKNQYSDGEKCIECTSDLEPCGDNSCCPPNMRCDNVGNCCESEFITSGICCKSQTFVDGKCCASGSLCYGSSVCCPPGYFCKDNKCIRTCDGVECGEFQTCQIFDGKRICADPPCPGPQINGSTCCDNNEFNSGGKCFECENNMPKCGTSCCQSNEVCIANKFCAPK